MIEKIKQKFAYDGKSRRTRGDEGGGGCLTNWCREGSKSADSADLERLNGHTIAEACPTSRKIQRSGGVQNGSRFEQMYFYVLCFNIILS